MIIILFIIGIVIIVAVAVSIKMEKNKSEQSENYFYEKGLTPTKKIGDFWIDEKNKKWSVAKYNGCLKIYNFSDIVDFELVENGTKYKSKGGISRSIIGGVAFGAVGAIVGATTAKKQTTINQLSVNIFLSSISDSLVTINFITGTTKTDGMIYQSAINLAKQTIATLTAIKNSCDNNLLS